MRLSRSAAVLAACSSLVLCTVPAAHAAAPVIPTSDPFYTYSGATPLAQITPGTVLAERAVSLSLNISTTPQTGVGLPGGPVETVPGEQLLYRTSDEVGKPSVTVTTVLVPATVVAPATVAPNIVAYLSFYDALSAKCDPSYTLTGGDPDSANTELSDLEQGLVAQYYALGYVVTVPDFEGTSLDWTAGHEAGYGTLDAVRATESYLGAPASSPVGLSGYSGGSIAADWASELAASYAPAVNLVGVAEGGVPVYFAHNLTYINGSQVWSGIMPAVLTALARSYGLDLKTYASDLGLKLSTQDRDECIGDFSGTTPGLTIDKLLKPEYKDFLAQPVFAAIINKLIMGSVPGHPAGPLFMAVGNDPANAQGQGDDIMVTKDVEALAHEYCSQGVTVQYAEYANSTHEQAALQFEPQATRFLTERFAGVTPATNDCASIPEGNSLAPLPVKAASAASSVSGSASTSTAKHTSATAEVSAPQRGLAATGGSTTSVLAALVLVGAAGAGLRRHLSHNS